MDLDSIDVRARDIGGGFGTKGFRLYPEELLVPFAARHLGLTVRWAEDRREHLVAATHQRSQVHDVRVGVDSEGRILALDVDFLHDMGAYSQFGLLIPLVTASGIVGPYRIDDVRVRFRAVYTNTVQVSPYRGSSTPFSTFVIERTLDQIARSLGLDRANVRRRNLLRPGDFPRDTGLRAAFGDGSATYDSGNYEPGLDQVLAAIGWDGFRGGAAGLARGSTVEGSVGAPFVGVLAEPLQRSLKLGDGPGGWSGRQPARQGLVEPLGLALGLGWPGAPFFWRTPSSARTYSKALRAPVNRLV